MNFYSPPLHEMLFAMKVEAIFEEPARFASEVLAPINARGDTQGCQWRLLPSLETT